MEKRLYLRNIAKIASYYMSAAYIVAIPIAFLFSDFWGFVVFFFGMPILAIIFTIDAILLTRYYDSLPDLPAPPLSESSDVSFWSGTSY